MNKDGEPPQGSIIEVWLRCVSLQGDKCDPSGSGDVAHHAKCSSDDEPFSGRKISPEPMERRNREIVPVQRADIGILAWAGRGVNGTQIVRIIPVQQRHNLENADSNVGDNDCEGDVVGISHIPVEGSQLLFHHHG